MLHLPTLNTATKYPSIPTYHALDSRGRLTDVVQVPFDEPVYATEKIDGTNVRIIVTHDDVFLGSREHLLWAKGDRVGDPAMGVVAALRDEAERVLDVALVPEGSLWVLYGELYGGKVGSAAREYGPESVTGFRLFDVRILPIGAVDALRNYPAAEVARWRDGGSAPAFLDWGRLVSLSRRLGLALVPTVLPASTLPTALADVLPWLEPHRATTAHLARGAGRSEGIVIRTADRSKIAKLRFADYERVTR